MSANADAIAKLAESLPRSGNNRGAKAFFGALPDGRKIDDLSDAQLASALKMLKIPGAGKSRDANVSAYERFLQEKFDEAGETALVLWTLEHDEEDADGKSDEEGDDR